MAVAVVMDFRGATLEQYDEVIRRMGFSKEGPGPAGELFHWVTATPDGVRVTDVWETREQFESFAEGHIGPRTREVGFTGTPEVSFHEVHNYLTSG